MFPGKATYLYGKPIAVEQGIELVEGEGARTASANQEQVALGETGLNGRDIERLQQLGLEQFTDSGDLMAW